MLICALTGSHALLVGVPGLAKTLLVKALASAFDWKYARIQFTPDLMPADITGYELLGGNRDSSGPEMVFRRGPVFANLVLADEINRAAPKTQSALLEAMAERHVTVGGRTHTLEEPFLVAATQNPIEQEGTYPLPEAQLDRFMMETRIDYPSPDQEEEIVMKTTAGPMKLPQASLSREEILHVVHPDEERLPRGVAFRFENMEEAGYVDCTPIDVQRAYRDRFAAHTVSVRRMSLSAGCDYRYVSTATSYLETLGEFLVQRVG